MGVVGSLILLLRDNHRGARLAAVAAVGAVVVAWGVAQWDYMLPETLTVADAAAPSGTITAVLVAAALAVVFIVPAFALLYSLDQRGLLPEDGIDDPRGRSLTATDPDNVHPTS